MTFGTNYSVVPLSEKPDKEGYYCVANDVGSEDMIYYRHEGGWDVHKPYVITGWLKPIPDSIIFTKEELEARDAERERRVAAEAWKACSIWTRNSGGGEFDTEAPNKETYLNSLINK